LYITSSWSSVYHILLQSNTSNSNA
jgi:hypothetical protein